MCGRYALSATAAELIEHFKLLACPEFGLRYNIAPQSMIPVIRQKPGTGRVGQLVKWGLIPSRAKDPSIGGKLNNARGETVAEKPAFRSSFA
jgi:putative SOS response-associated peptidase YedK